MNESIYQKMKEMRPQEMDKLEEDLLEQLEGTPFQDLFIIMYRVIKELKIERTGLIRDNSFKGCRITVLEQISKPCPECGNEVVDNGIQGFKCVSCDWRLTYRDLIDKDTPVTIRHQKE